MEHPRLTAVHECFALLADGDEREAAARHAPDIVAEARRLLDADRVLDERDTPAPRSPDAQTSLVGTTIAGFELVGTIGAGSSGQVYLARQSRPDRLVAFKLLWPSTRAEARDAEREIAALAALEHPGIARLYQAGTWECAGAFRTWMAMEHVEGARPLDLALAGSSSLRSRVVLLAELADAIAYAHGCGIIHRDLKPANVLVDRGGRAVVIDFGVARRDTDQGRTVTMLGERVVGTLAYMAPETLQHGRAIDARTDIFSLGAIAYELLAGATMRRLTGLSLPQALAAIQASVPPRLGVLDRRLRGDLDRIIAKATDNDPTRRYAGAALLAHDLRLHLAGMPVLIEQQPLRERFVRWVRRHWRLTTALASSAAVLIVTTLISLRFAHEASAQARRATLAAAASALEAQDQLAFGQALAALPSDGTPEIALLQRAQRSRGESIASGDWYAVAVSPDESWIAGVVARGRAYRLERLAGNECAWTTPIDGVMVGGLSISPDGRFIAVARSNGSLCIVDAEDGRVLREVAPMSDDSGGDVGWLDATTVVHAVRAVRVVDASTGEVQRVSDDLGVGAARSISRSNNGDLVIAAERGACVIDDTLALAQRLETPPYRQSASESCDDGSFVIGGWDRTVRRYHPGSPIPLWTGRVHHDIIWSIGVLPDGRPFSVGADGLLVIWDSPTGAAVTVPVSDDVVWTAAISGDALMVGSMQGLRRLSLADLAAWAGVHGIAPTTVMSPQWTAAIDAQGRAVVGESRAGAGETAGSGVVVCTALNGRRLQRIASTNDARWLVAVDSAGDLNAFDARTGALLWRTGVASHEDDHEPGGIAAIAVDAGRGRVVVGSRHYGCVALSLADGSVQWTREIGAQCACAGVSGVDGSIIAASRDGLLVLLDERDGTVRASARHQRTRPQRIDFTPDGSCAVVAGSDGVLRLVDAHMLEERLTLRVSSAPLDALWIADDGIWTVDREGVRRRR